MSCIPSYFVRTAPLLPHFTTKENVGELKCVLCYWKEKRRGRGGITLLWRGCWCLVDEVGEVEVQEFEVDR